MNREDSNRFRGPARIRLFLTAIVPVALMPDSEDGFISG